MEASDSLCAIYNKSRNFPIVDFFFENGVCFREGKKNCLRAVVSFADDSLWRSDDATLFRSSLSTVFIIIFISPNVLESGHCKFYIVDCAVRRECGHKTRCRSNRFFRKAFPGICSNRSELHRVTFASPDVRRHTRLVCTVCRINFSVCLRSRARCVTCCFVMSDLSDWNTDTS